MTWSGRVDSTCRVSTLLDLSKLSHAEKDRLILALFARLAEAQERIAAQDARIAALEARCVGLPVVGYVTTGMSEFVGHAVEGFLCRDDADMVSRLRQLCEDEELRLQMSEHNRTTPSPMTWQRALQRHDAVYDEVQAGHLPPRSSSRAVAGGRGFSR